MGEVEGETYRWEALRGVTNHNGWTWSLVLKETKKEKFLTFMTQLEIWILTGYLITVRNYVYLLDFIAAMFKIPTKIQWNDIFGIWLEQ